MISEGDATMGWKRLRRGWWRELGNRLIGVFL